MSQSDLQYMARAIKLAWRGLYTTMPNPRVGCVIVAQDEIVGEGWHQWAGEGHAEVNALAEAGARAEGATAYVTLEPCSHHGKTPPCCEALIQARVARVVVAMEDPNPLVSGRGSQRLREAGIEVISGVLEAEAQALNPGFIKRMQTGRPWVRCKLAMSLDGRTAMASGESQWITGPAARADVQQLRARSCAMLTGSGTVLHDNASLTVRADELTIANAAEAARIQPLRVVLDSQARLDLSRRIFDEAAPTLWVTAQPGDVAASATVVERLVLQAGDGTIDLPALLNELGRRQCNEVLVEAGAELAGALVAAGLVDELIVYMAPTLMGSAARPLLALPGIDSMAARKPLSIVDVRAVGADWRITARPT